MQVVRRFINFSRPREAHERRADGPAPRAVDVAAVVAPAPQASALPIQLPCVQAARLPQLPAKSRPTSEVFDTYQFFEHAHLQRFVDDVTFAQAVLGDAICTLGEGAVCMQFDVSALPTQTATVLGLPDKTPLRVTLYVEDDYQGSRPKFIVTQGSPGRRTPLASSQNPQGLVGAGTMLSAALRRYTTSLWKSDSNPIIELHALLQDRLASPHRHCWTCDTSVQGESLPACCANPLCDDPDTRVSLLASNGGTGQEVADLFLSMAMAAVQGPKAELFGADAVKMMPRHLSSSIMNEQLAWRPAAVVCENADADTTVADARANMQLKRAACRTACDKAMLGTLPAAFWSWLLKPSSVDLALLSPQERFESMQTPWQFKLTSYGEHANRFAALRGSNSFWAFHGSPFSNWHSIVRTQLRNVSGTSMQLHGAAFGKGVYVAANSSLSSSFARQAEAWPQSHMGASLRALALCEIAPGTGVKIARESWVVSQSDRLMVRYLFVYTPEAVLPACAAQDLAQHAQSLLPGSPL